jgi:hypothetical protein
MNHLRRAHRIGRVVNPLRSMMAWYHAIGSEHVVIRDASLDVKALSQQLEQRYARPSCRPDQLGSTTVDVDRFSKRFDSQFAQNRLAHHYLPIKRVAFVTSS